MKLLMTLLLFLKSTLSSFAQQVENISNSFENDYRKSNPILNYSYDNSVQTHDYSNNWDFDKDGIKDELYFVGTGGAHLYYFLKVVLSTDKKPRAFNFVESDLPKLTATDTLNFNKNPYGFVVANFGVNSAPSIVVKLDNQSYFANKKLLTKMNIRTKNVVISFEKGKTKFGSL